MKKTIRVYFCDICGSKIASEKDMGHIRIEANQPSLKQYPELESRFGEAKKFSDWFIIDKDVCDKCFEKTVLAVVSPVHNIVIPEI